MNWILLIIGGFFEVGFTSCLSLANKAGSTERWMWLIGFVISLSMSMFLLYRATSGSQGLPMGTAYAVWTGIGAVGTVLMGIFVFHEPLTFWRIFFLFTLITSIIGLKLVTNG